MSEKIMQLIQSPETDIRAGAWPLPNGQIEGTLDLYENDKLVATLLTASPDAFSSKEEAIASMNLVLRKIMQMAIKVGGT